MERTKRPHNDDTVDTNKKQKLLTNKSHFENLANETIYEIFEYLDIYHIYEGFFYLNQRFKNLIIHTNLPIQINIPTVSKSNLDLYHKNLIKPNKHRINYFRISNPFTVDLIFSPPRIISEFIQLETLILDNIDPKYLHNILKYSVYLLKLHLNLVDYIQDPSTLFLHLFRLPKLKSCKLTYQTKYNQQIYFTDFVLSPIEYLEINNRFSIDSLCHILHCLPKLRYLSIDCLVGSNYRNIDKHLITLIYLQNISITLDNIHFYLFEQLIKSFFSGIENLRITTHDPSYLNPNRWEDLILSSMPNLRIFDIHLTSILQQENLIYMLSIYGFHSSFWTQRGWSFTHEHEREKKSHSVLFYSKNPYRRKDFVFYSRTEQQNFNSVKHVYIYKKYAIHNSINYFPNVDQLTIEIFDNSMLTALNRILPLKQLTTLVIKSSNSLVEQIIKLIRFTPNLHTLKLDFLSLKSSEQSEDFQYVSNTNQIKTLEFLQPCSLENIQLVLSLFPQVEYLKIGMIRKEIHQIIRFLCSEIHDKTCRLLFLCISQIPKVCLRELNMLIKIENLFNVYFIKYIKRDLYLWW